MTHSEQDLLLHRLLCQPETLTGEEMAAALADPELRELYATAAELRSAALSGREYDTDKEWEAFRASSHCPLQGKAAPKVASGTVSVGKVISHPWWRRLGRGRAAAIILVASLGAAAATLTFTVRALKGNQPTTERTQDTLATRPAQRPATEVLVTKERLSLSADLAFENQSLGEIARQVADSLACDVVVADEETAALRLYLTLPKGSTVADFAAVIDSYELLGAKLKEGVVTIKKKEAKR